jgi:hypothetical protein
MSPDRWHPSIVMDVQVLVTHADSVTLMEREMGHPPRIVRGPDLCYLFQARDAERLPGLVDRWESYGITAQVVQIPSIGSCDSPPTPST